MSTDAELFQLTHKVTALEREDARKNARIVALEADMAAMRKHLDLYARTACAVGGMDRVSVMDRVRADSAMLAARGDMSGADVRGRLTPCPGAADGLEAIVGGVSGSVVEGA